MVCRKCPRCGGEWYTADTGPRPCAYCGAMLDKRHDKALEKEVEKGDSFKILR